MASDDVEIISVLGKRTREVDASNFACLICTDLMFEPTVFQCGHSVCFKCSLNLRRKIPARCPSCNELVSQATRNHFLRSLIESTFPEEYNRAKIANERLTLVHALQAKYPSFGIHTSKPIPDHVVAKIIKILNHLNAWENPSFVRELSKHLSDTCIFSASEKMQCFNGARLASILSFSWFKPDPQRPPQPPPSASGIAATTAQRPLLFVSGAQPQPAASGNAQLQRPPQVVQPQQQNASYIVIANIGDHWFPESK